MTGCTRSAAKPCISYLGNAARALASAIAGAFWLNLCETTNVVPSSKQEFYNLVRCGVIPIGIILPRRHHLQLPHEHLAYLERSLNAISGATKLYVASAIDRPWRDDHLDNQISALHRCDSQMKDSAAYHDPHGPDCTPYSVHLSPQLLPPSFADASKPPPLSLAALMALGDTSSLLHPPKECAHHD